MTATHQRSNVSKEILQLLHCGAYHNSPWMPTHTHRLFKTAHNVLHRRFYKKNSLKTREVAEVVMNRNFPRQHMATNQQTKTQLKQSNSHTMAVKLTYTVLTVQSPLFAAALSQAAISVPRTQRPHPKNAPFLSDHETRKCLDLCNSQDSGRTEDSHTYQR